MKIISIVILACPIIFSQQVRDSTYNPAIGNPEYGREKGPVIFIDQAHHNFHTMSERYKPFADILEKDGYKVEPYTGSFTKSGLDHGKILVISNALNERNTEDWTLPTPSAFTVNEIDQVENWVNGGGSLLLIADHMPFPGAAGELAERFGFNLKNGFALDTSKQPSPDLFTRKNGTLIESFITNGRNKKEYVDSIYSFTGEGFQIPDDAVPVLELNKNFVFLMPDTAWNFSKNTPRVSAAGWMQGAVKKSGKGKVAMWGEAAMFSAQFGGNQKFGLNAPYAKDNLQLLLNIIHWLDIKGEAEN